MAITEWHTPIHECQKGEVQREWCYLEPYYFFTGNLKDYSKLLKYAFKKQHTPNQPSTNPQYEKFLEKHPICFHPYDIEKGEPPSHDQLKNWSKGQNISCDEKHNWDERRSSKRNEIGRLQSENMAAQFAEDMPYFYNTMKDDIEMVNESVDNARMMGNLTPHQAESATKAKHHIIDGVMKITGKDKDYNVKADVNADIDAKAEVETKSNIAQDIILKPEYVELTRKLLEDVVNDS